MDKKLLWGIILMGSCLFTFCDRDDFISYNENHVAVIMPLGDEAYLTQNSNFIFDQDSLFTFELIIPEENYDKLNSDPAAEEYVQGQLIFRGDTLSPVGIRYKGSIGAFAGCLSGDDVADPSGKKTCTKLSMKVKINWMNDDDTFFNLKKLQFHSQNHDKTQMHERLAYYLFREMGVVAPRSVHARLIINGEYSGLYALTEQIDGRFANKNFIDGTGNLYKEIWPINQHGNPYWEKTYLEHLRTNEDEHPDADLIQSFARGVSDADTDKDLKTVIRKWMNIDQIMSYAVVDRTIRADDGPFHWYEHKGRIYNHNYYWYEEPSQQKLYLIPWDLDNAFENIIDDQNSITAIADQWGIKSANCQAYEYGAGGRKQRSASCDKLTGGWANFKQEYIEKQDEFIRGPFSNQITEPLLLKWEEQIKEATEQAETLHHDALSSEKWKIALNDLRAGLEYARNK